MDKQQFKKMLDDYLAGKLTGKEKEQAEQWFDDARIYQDEDSIPWSKTDHEELRALIHAKMNVRKETPVRSIGLYRWLQIAASVLLVSLVSYYVWNKATASSIQYAKASSVMQKVILLDGTIVWLKPHSTLTYPEYFSGDLRQVELQGEALFEVAKDARHPFVIQCGELTATVLGTSFNIKANDKQIEVAVLTGKVALTSSNDQQGIVLLPQEKAVYKIARQEISKNTAEPSEVSTITEHTEYNMQFYKTAVREIIKRMEDKFDVKVDANDMYVADCSITVNFTDQSLETTLSNMATLLEFEYTIQNGVVTIHGGTCQ